MIDMTKKFDDFKADLIDLCKKHDVIITTSGYDLIEVWDLDYDIDLLINDRLDDCTEQSVKHSI